MGDGAGQEQATSPSVEASATRGWLVRLKALKGVIVGVAGVGAVLSGLVGYYTTFKTVSAPGFGRFLAEAPKAASAKSIAVLPFANMSGDAAQEYFSDGISEELLNHLAQVHDLFVIARTSSFSFKGKDLKTQDIAKALNVAHILQGSIRTAGNRVRISAQLVRAADGEMLWSQAFDREMSDIFAVQDEISAAVVEQLKVKLLGAEPKAQTVKPEAYALFLQARSLVGQASREGYEQAMSLLKQALALEPGYARALELLAAVYIEQADSSLRPIEEGYRLGQELADRALQADPREARTYALLARIAANHDQDLARAARLQQQALDLAPEDAHILFGASVLLLNIGRVEQAYELRARLVLRDPANAGFHARLAAVKHRLGRHDEAIQEWRQALALSPQRLSVHYSIGMAMLRTGHPREALAEMQLEPAASVWHLIGPAMAWHALGEKARSDAALADLIRQYEKSSAYDIAYVYAYRGEADNAFAWLEKAREFRDGGLPSAMVNTELARLHNDPRWLPFLRKIGLAPEQVAAIRLDIKDTGQ